MKLNTTKSIVAVIAASSALALADADHGTVSRPDAHAPIGVMGDHTHKAGEWMVSYRSMYMGMGAHRAGTNSLSTQQVIDAGYSMIATEMEMEMQMLGFMYAPTDKLTLMAMTNYVTKDMEMVMDMSSMHGHGHGTGTGAHSHSTEGFGDSSITALYNVFKKDGKSLHIKAGLGLPTAEVDEKMSGSFQPYGMQLGRGTFDLLLGATYQQHLAKFSWGAQANACIALEDENESGFKFGDTVDFTTWIARPVNEWLSVSARLTYSYQSDIKGHYNGAHGHSAPNHLQENYGGHLAQVGFGANVIIPRGALQGNRFAIEALFPIIQDNNGVGMEQDFTVTAGWQLAF